MTLTRGSKGHFVLVPSSVADSRDRSTRNLVQSWADCWLLVDERRPSDPGFHANRSALGFAESMPQGDEPAHRGTSDETPSSAVQQLHGGDAHPADVCR